MGADAEQSGASHCSESLGTFAVDMTSAIGTRTASVGSTNFGAVWLQGGVNLHSKKTLEQKWSRGILYKKTMFWGRVWPVLASFGGTDFWTTKFIKNKTKTKHALIPNGPEVRTPDLGRESKS